MFYIYASGESTTPWELFILIEVSSTKIIARFTHSHFLLYYYFIRISYYFFHIHNQSFYKLFLRTKDNLKL
jgi:hypothetical protein